jgi:PncC family amidohydrolase
MPFTGLYLPCLASLLIIWEHCVEESLEIKIGGSLREQGLKLATAESCTGGLIGHRLTNIPGSSDYYLGGIIAYAYEAKVALLDVSWDTLHQYGAVSRETVLEMARGARKALEADIAVSVSGIAGPGGGLPGKPVGTTWLGLAAADGEWARVFCFLGEREANKAYSAEAALRLVWDYLCGDRALDDSDLLAKIALKNSLG